MSLNSCSRKFDVFHARDAMSVPCFFYGAHYKIKQLLLRTRVQLRAALCGFGCSFFAARQRTNQESAPKAAAFGNCFRAALHRGKGERYRSFFFIARHTATTSGGVAKQGLLPLSVCEFLSFAHANAEDAYFREKMSRARAPRPFRAAGIQRALGPLAPFFRHFLGRTKKWQQCFY